MKTLRDLCQGQLPKLVLFDLDGTLIDSVPDIATATDTMLTSLGAEPAGEAKVRSWVGNGAATLVARALQDAGIEAGQQEVAMTLWRAAYTLCCTRQTRLYPGAMELLRALSDADIDMALVTNKPVQFAQPILQHLGIARYFRLVLGGECVAEKKPAPDMLLEAIADAGCDKALCVMVGDSSADINAAKNAGIAVVAVNFGYDNGAPVASLNPTLVIDSLSALVQ
ncbi:phosphoglycolate phosphatase [Simiduia curdlanivorans]|uniref:Phosphoglycolate phosphatase n=1 Tax=Simiduia curdlanivorans TaxID=1492769 RepID=A0ABV8V4A8_9GAMM|nr:phosphoglycolate phosphatase [Simiduia curdlanivorans]MDN3637253.1 phosphoglycolate phosphatase [Simiduia curdlanivorans]